MTNTLLDISGKIDAQATQALAAIKAAAEALDAPFFVIGATARDIFLKHLYGFGDFRMTRDMDFGVSLSSWEAYSALKNTLIKSQGFEVTGQMQRLRKGKVLIDIVPFGSIAGAAQKIRWPPYGSREMTTMGFTEAFDASVPVKVGASPEVVVRVCSPAGLVMLKLISWKERYPERQQDAADVLEIMEKYERAVGEERLYDEASDLIVEEEFDNRRAAVRLLGRDIASIASPETVGMIRSILKEETMEGSRLSLAYDMAREAGIPEDKLEAIRAMLLKLKQGIAEASARSDA